MADPRTYNPAYSFVGYQTDNPTDPLPAPPLDNEFFNIAQAINGHAAAITDVRREDGALNNEIVTPESLSPAVALMISNAGGLPGPVTAGAVLFTPVGNIAATTVQAAIHELDGEKAKAGANGDITSLSGLTTPLGINAGGTGGTTAAAARIGLSVQEMLTASRIYYVATTGSDINPGTAGAPFLTIQKAASVAVGLNFGTWNVTVQVADGTYAAGAAVNSPLVSAGGQLFFVGNTTTPANVVINGPGVTCFAASGGASFSVSGFEVRGNVGLFATRNSTISVGAAMRFGAATAYQIYGTIGGYIEIAVDYSIVGGGINHIALSDGGKLACTSRTITLTGTPAFSTFFGAGGVSSATYFLNTFSGSATGQRYSVSGNSVLNVNGASATYLPGNAAGAEVSGGRYI